MHISRKEKRIELHKKLVSIVAMTVLLTSLLFTVAQATPEQRFSKDLNWVCGTPRIDNEAYLKKYGDMEPDTGNPLTIMVSDDYHGIEYPQDFVSVVNGTHARIWIGLNDSITLSNGTVVSDYQDAEGNFHFFYPWSDIGTSWLWPGYHDVISMENLTYMLQQFDEVIYSNDTSYFGMPEERPSGDTKIDILIFNIRDEVFWSPETAEYYTAGYFSSAASLLNTLNIIHIDTYEWIWRLGPNPPPDGPALIPYMYEGVVAHEFEHLIHFDMDSDEELWVDEGCADFAGFLCGYGHPADHIANYLVYHPFTSLTVWGGGLEDYGASYLFMLYLSEQYGGANFISGIVSETANGLEGINNVLEAWDVEETFDEIFDDWIIANYLDNTEIAEGQYGYEQLDIPSADTWGWSIQAALSTFWGVPPYDGRPNKETGSFSPYTAHYYRFEKGSPKFGISFDGDNRSAVIPRSGTLEWWSTMANWAWHRLHKDFPIPSTGATLKFWTYYEIEKDWDYGYVEVHDLTTNTWTTLPGVRTTTTLPYIQDNPNTPSEFEPSNYSQGEKWNALTGFSIGWYQEEMDLSQFAGHNIELYFTYWTDGAWMEIGWYIDDIEISGPDIEFFDGVEDADGWTVDNGWQLTSGIVDNNFSVNFVQISRILGEQDYVMTSMEIDPDTEDGLSGIMMRFKNKIVNLSTVMIVSNHQPGAPLKAGYAWKAVPLGWGR